MASFGSHRDWAMSESLDSKVSDGIALHERDPAGSAPRRYVPPTLTVLGDMRGLTLGGSPGLGDSGPAGFDPLGG